MFKSPEEFNEMYRKARIDDPLLNKGVGAEEASLEKHKDIESRTVFNINENLTITILHIACPRSSDDEKNTIKWFVGDASTQENKKDFIFSLDKNVRKEEYKQLNLSKEIQEAIEYSITKGEEKRTETQERTFDSI
jgi:hypothetical protein